LFPSSAVAIPFPIGAIVGIAAGFVIAISAVVFLCLRNRALTHRYNLLKDQNENFRLSDLTSTALQVRGAGRDIA